MIQYQFFPKNSRTPDSLRNIVNIFFDKEGKITSAENQLKSDEVLGILSKDIESLGYLVEKSKKLEDKIRVPVLFGRNDLLEKYFEVDCYNPNEKIVIEIEAGRAVANYQFLKDLFQASVMHNVDYLVIAVRNVYNERKDFEIVVNFLDTLYVSDRLRLPLKGILIIGY